MRFAFIACTAIVFFTYCKQRRDSKIVGIGVTGSGEETSGCIAWFEKGDTYWKYCDQIANCDYKNGKKNITIGEYKNFMKDIYTYRNKYNQVVNELYHLFHPIHLEGTSRQIRITTMFKKNR